MYIGTFDPDPLGYNDRSSISLNPLNVSFATFILFGLVFLMAIYKVTGIITEEVINQMTYIIISSIPLRKQKHYRVPPWILDKQTDGCVFIIRLIIYMVNKDKAVERQWLNCHLCNGQNNKYFISMTDLFSSFITSYKGPVHTKTDSAGRGDPGQSIWCGMATVGQILPRQISKWCKQRMGRCDWFRRIGNCKWYIHLGCDLPMINSYKRYMHLALSFGKFYGRYTRI